MVCERAAGPGFNPGAGCGCDLPNARDEMPRRLKPDSAPNLFVLLPDGIRRARSMKFSTTNRLVKSLAAPGALLGLPVAANAEWGLNLTPGVTPFSRTIYDLHMLILWVCVVIGIVVFGLMFYSIMKFRKSQGAQAAQWHESTKVEVLWTLIPFIILVGIAVPATKALIMMEDVSGADMTIKVTGYQWKWHYQYVDDGVGFFSTLDADSNNARRVITSGYSSAIFFNCGTTLLSPILPSAAAALLRVTSVTDLFLGSKRRSSADRLVFILLASVVLVRCFFFIAC